MYYGKYDNAKSDGYGLLRHIEKDKNMIYYGTFTKNNRVQGTSIYPDGSFHSGQYAMNGDINVYTGTGQLFRMYPEGDGIIKGNGDYYVGEFTNGQISGKG